MADRKPKLSRSGVSWTDYSWGVVDGCTKVSEACKNCYAEAMVTRFQPGRKFFDVICHSERLEAPLNTRKGGKVFVAPLGDLFHEKVPHKFVYEVFKVMRDAQQHTFQILTKRPQQMYDFVKWYIMQTTDQLPDNIWLGVTAENQEQADKRIPILLQIPAAVRFVSVEPMLGPVDLNNWIWGNRCPDPQCGDSSWDHDCELGEQMLHLVILGGESGPHARPMHPDDARSVRDQCVAAGVKFYFKQWGEFKPADFQSSESLCNPLFALLKNGAVKKVSFDEFNYYNNQAITSAFVSKVGTKKAGSLLDGREWKQFPEVGA